MWLIRLFLPVEIFKTWPGFEPAAPGTWTLYHFYPAVILNLHLYRHRQTVSKQWRRRDVYISFVQFEIVCCHDCTPGTVIASLCPFINREVYGILICFSQRRCSEYKYSTTIHEDNWFGLYSVRFGSLSTLNCIIKKIQL